MRDERRAALAYERIGTSVLRSRDGASRETWPRSSVAGEQAERQSVDRRDGARAERSAASEPNDTIKFADVKPTHEGPGEIKCQNVFLNGGLWLVVRPAGTLVR